MVSNAELHGHLAPPASYSLKTPEPLHAGRVSLARRMGSTKVMRGLVIGSVVALAMWVVVAALIAWAI
ncbi:hypothetical protein [uncultured Sphingomonas sp.]|uniref:hypothetical protein n=1 Tax=uncultured Sphingomonas sp. TaxID=158754 RepID=UPI0035C9F7D1